MAGWTRVQEQSWGLGSGYISKEELIGFADGLDVECKMKRLCLVKEQQMLDEIGNVEMSDGGLHEEFRERDYFRNMNLTNVIICKSQKHGCILLLLF